MGVSLFALIVFPRSNVSLQLYISTGMYVLRTDIICQGIKWVTLTESRFAFILFPNKGEGEGFKVILIKY